MIKQSGATLFHSSSPPRAHMFPKGHIAAARYVLVGRTIALDAESFRGCC